MALLLPLGLHLMMSIPKKVTFSAVGQPAWPRKTELHSIKISLVDLLAAFLFCSLSTYRHEQSAITLLFLVSVNHYFPVEMRRSSAGSCCFFLVDDHDCDVAASKHDNLHWTKWRTDFGRPETAYLAFFRMFGAIC